MLPILLTNFQNNIKVLIVGGGKVALRRTKCLIDSGVTNIDIISPEFDAGFSSLKDNVFLQKTAYFQQDLSQYTIILSCAGKAEINDEVEKDARESKVLFNRADKSDLSDFYIPAIIRRGDITISINSGVPSLSKKIKHSIESILPDEFTEYSKKLNKIRTLLNKNKIDKNKTNSILEFFSNNHNKLDEIDTQSPTAFSDILGYYRNLTKD